MAAAAVWPGGWEADTDSVPMANLLLTNALQHAERDISECNLCSTEHAIFALILVFVRLSNSFAASKLNQNNETRQKKVHFVTVGSTVIFLEGDQAGQPILLPS